MADHRSQQQATPTSNNTKACTSLFGHPNFRAFTTKCLSWKETLKSPTSVLESIPFFLHGNTLSSQTERGQTKCLSRTYSGTERKAIGLAIIDSLKDESMKENSAKPCKAKVVFGTQLRVQIPDALPPPHFATVASSKSPADFGIKNRNLHVSTNGAADSGIHGQMTESAENFLMSEMELSEDYTCVICHGPNPKTTRIFDNCILETYCSLPNDNSTSTPENFLSFCHTCKKNLHLSKDILIYRGEKAFCSHACRRLEMLLDGMGHSEFDDGRSIDIS